MGKARDEAGNIWETDAQGNPVRMLQPAQSNPMNNPFVDPRLQYQVQAAQGQAAAAPFEGPKAASDAAAASAQARIAEANANVANAKNGADLEKAKLELEKLKLELANTQTGKGSALNALQTQVDRVGTLYRQNLQGGVPNFLNDVIPDFLQPNKGQFDAAAQGLTNPFQSAFKVQGQGSQSDTELRQFIEANVPKQGDSDAVIQEKLGNIQTRIDAERGNLGQNPPAPPQNRTSADPMAIATGGTRDQIDPVLKATGQRVGQMLAQGVPDGKIRDFLLKSGVNPADTSVESALKFRRSKDFQTWQRQNPGAPYPIGPNFYTKQVPMSDARSLFNKTAATDLGGAAAAYGAAAGNAVLGGRIDNLSSNPEMANTGMELLRSQHPLASFGGDLMGQGLVEGSVGRIPGAQALMASRWGRRGADALYGAYSGSGEANSAEGGITGALANLGGGMAGRGLQRGAGRLMTGVKNPDLQLLNQEGVPLTIGRIARGSENVVGHALGGLEERFAGLPIADAVIGSARQRGDEGFNKAIFRRVGANNIGSAGAAETRQLRNQAYSFLDPISLPQDAQYAGRSAAIQAGIPNLPAHGEGVSKQIGIINGMFSPELSGRDWQAGVRALRTNRASLNGKDFPAQAQDALGEVENNLFDLAARQGPAGTAANLQKANRLNADYKTILKALDSRPAQRNGELFDPITLDAASRAGAKTYGGQAASIEGHRPFYDITKAGMAVMPSLTPDSGTAGRAIAYAGGAGLVGTGAGLGAGTADDGERGAGSLNGAMTGAGITAMLAAPYSKTGQKLLQKMLLGDRNRVVEKIGNYLIVRPRAGGMFGSALSRDYFMQPELGQ